MDAQLFKIIGDLTPKFNPRLAEGLAVEQMKLVERYIDNVLRCAEGSFPEGLKYVRMVRCTPEEHYAQVTQRANSKRYYEFSKSTVFLVKLIFSFNGKEMFPRYIYLPYVDDSGLITIRGSVFAISPVLTDRAVSVSGNSLFIPLTRDKLTFERLPHSYRTVSTEGDNEAIQRGHAPEGKRVDVYVVWSQIYHINAAVKAAMEKPQVVAESTLMHYLLCKYGLTETFARFANAKAIVGDACTLTREFYPESDWVICYTSQTQLMKPKGVKNKLYAPSELRIAIPRAQWNQVTQDLIGAFFYIVDHFPERVEPEYVDETRLWKILLGHVIFASQVGEGKLVEQIEAHIVSLDEYLDLMTIENLREDGIFSNDLYELFMHIIETLTDRVMNSADQVASMYDKRLTVLRYVMLNVVKAIFGMTFKLRSNTKRQLTEKDVVNVMNRLLKRDLIMSINNGHGEVASVSYPGDCKVFKITSSIVLQRNSTGGGRSKSNIDDPSKRLHVSTSEVGGYSNLPKSDPTGQSKVNFYVEIEADGTIVRDQRFVPLLDETQRNFQQ